MEQVHRVLPGYGLHFLQDLCQAKLRGLLARVRTRRLRRSEGSGTPNNDD